jgi:hypothetical protein
MATQLQLRRGNTSQTAAFTGASAEVTIDTTKNTIVIHDGVTPGGFPLASNSDFITIQNVNTTQNTRIDSANNTARAAYDKANAAFDKANTGVSTSTDDYARATSNTATNNITILQGVNTTQNTNITYATNLAQAALDAANAITGGTHSIEYLVVGGGGAGGSYFGGGGGAGGFRTSSGLEVEAGTYTVTVGAGGTGGAVNARGANGTNSVFSSITSAGGGGGGGFSDTAGNAGGSGGGGGNSGGSGGAGNTPSTSPSQGNSGGTGNGGGGGGASAVGANAVNSGGWGQGNGGAGTASSITGASVTYAGGGGGGAQAGRPGGTGGAGGGGTGEVENDGTGSAGTVNTGGGGGGRGGNNGGRAGGSGIVILRTTSLADSTTGSPTLTYDGAYNIYAFTSSGSITFPTVAATTPEVIDDYARVTSNTATNNITILQNVNTTQNTRISSVDNTANAAYAKANAAFDKANTGGSGSSSGYLANSVIFANTTGYLSNTNSIQFFTSNNNLVLTGNIIAGGVRNTTSSSAPANPTVGDIWYKTTNDKVYRYTYDGAGNYWIDINTPTGFTNTVSTTTSTNIIISTISITDNSYAILDDTAVSNSGGYIQIAGTNFSSNCSVIIGSNNTISTTVVNSSIIRAQVGAALPTSYHVYITDSGTGAVGIKPNGLTYSSFPVWGTGSTLTGVNANTPFSQTLSANSDSNIVYSNTSILPTNTSLLANGYFYGNVSVGIQTTYNFDVKATDVEIQDTSRAFSLTVSPFLPPGSVYFNGSSRIKTPANSNFAFGTGDFTVECWVKGTSTGGAIIDARATGGTTTGWTMWQGSAGYIFFYSGGNILGPTGTLDMNYWNHISVTRSSGTFRLFLNGSLSTSATPSSYNFTDNEISIASDNYGVSETTSGYISNVRIVKGTSLYNSSFSVPTAPLTAVSGTVLLTCQSPVSIFDASPYSYTLTIDGSPTVSNINPF